MRTIGVALRSGVFPAGEAVELELESDESLPVLEPESLLPVLPPPHADDVHACVEVPTHEAPVPKGDGFVHVRSWRPGWLHDSCPHVP
jgi:hypothetical protein